MSDSIFGSGYALARSVPVQPTTKTAVSSPRDVLNSARQTAQPRTEALNTQNQAVARESASTPIGLPDSDDDSVRETPSHLVITPSRGLSASPSVSRSEMSSTATTPVQPQPTTATSQTETKRVLRAPPNPPFLKRFHAPTSQDRRSSQSASKLSPGFRNLLIDTDGGCDDALAMVCALQDPSCHLAAITTVHGNVDVSVATENVAILLHRMATAVPNPPAHNPNRDFSKVPFFRGCGTALVETDPSRLPPKWAGHGTDGMGDAFADLRAEMREAASEARHSASPSPFPTAGRAHAVVAMISVINKYYQRHLEHVQNLVEEGRNEEIANPPALRGLRGFVDACDSNHPADYVKTEDADSEEKLGHVVEDLRIHIVTLGPLTNLAMALRLDPSIAQKIGSVTVLGGVYRGRGNCGRMGMLQGEFNLASDPEAAHVVFSSFDGMKARPVQLVTWELCEDHPIPWSWFERVALHDGAVAAFVKAFSSGYYHWARTGKFYNPRRLREKEPRHDIIDTDRSPPDDMKLASPRANKVEPERIGTDDPRIGPNCYYKAPFLPADAYAVAIALHGGTLMTGKQPIDRQLHSIDGEGLRVQGKDPQDNHRYGSSVLPLPTDTTFDFSPWSGFTLTHCSVELGGRFARAGLCFDWYKSRPKQVLSLPHGLAKRLGYDTSRSTPIQSPRSPKSSKRRLVRLYAQAPDNVLLVQSMDVDLFMRYLSRACGVWLPDEENWRQRLAQSRQVEENVRQQALREQEKLQRLRAKQERLRRLNRESRGVLGHMRLYQHAYLNPTRRGGGGLSTPSAHVTPSPSATPERVEEESKSRAPEHSRTREESLLAPMTSFGQRIHPGTTADGDLLNIPVVGGEPMVKILERPRRNKQVDSDDDSDDDSSSSAQTKVLSDTESDDDSDDSDAEPKKKKQVDSDDDSDDSDDSSSVQTKAVSDDDDSSATAEAESESESDGDASDPKADADSVVDTAQSEDREEDSEPSFVPPSTSQALRPERDSDSESDDVFSVSSRPAPSTKRTPPSVVKLPQPEPEPEPEFTPPAVSIPFTQIADPDRLHAQLTAPPQPWRQPELAPPLPPSFVYEPRKAASPTSELVPPPTSTGVSRGLSLIQVETPDTSRRPSFAESRDPTRPLALIAAPTEPPSEHKRASRGFVLHVARNRSSDLIERVFGSEHAALLRKSMEQGIPSGGGGHGDDDGDDDEGDDESSDSESMVTKGKKSVADDSDSDDSSDGSSSAAIQEEPVSDADGSDSSDLPVSDDSEDSEDW